MKCASWIAVVGAFAVATTIPAAAAEERKEVQGYVAAGYVLPQGRAADFLNDGWNISGGAIFRPAPERPFGVRVDLGYSSMDVNSKVVSFLNAQKLQADDGYMSMGNLTAEALWEFGSNRVGGYIGVGIGGYRRYTALTATALVSGVYCDPWWGWCYPYTTVGDVVTNSDSLTKLGYSASAGITFGLGPGQMYLEARYHYMISDPATEYIPIVLGYRF